MKSRSHWLPGTLTLPGLGVIFMFGIHTMKLRLDFDVPAEWFALRSIIGPRSKGKHLQRGVVHHKFRYVAEANLYCLYVGIDPAIMLGRLPFSITSIDDVRRLLPQAFSSWLSSLSSLSLPDLLDWQVQRLDYAVDIHCDSQDIAEAYAATACRGRLPRYLRQKYEQTSRNLHVKNKRECFQVYAKQLQIRDRHPNASPNVVAQYSGVVRCEIQLNRAKLKSISKDQGFGGYTLRHFLNEKLAASLIMGRIREVSSPAGEHRTLTGAKQTIAAHETNGKISTAEVKKLRQFLDWVSRYPSLEDARNACCAGNGIIKSLQTFETRIDDLAALGIALPCIPRHCPVTRLPRIILALASAELLEPAITGLLESGTAGLMGCWSTEILASGAAGMLSSGTTGADECLSTIESSKITACIPQSPFTVHITPFEHVYAGFNRRFIIAGHRRSVQGKVIKRGILNKLFVVVDTGRFGLPPPHCYCRKYKAFQPP